MFSSPTLKILGIFFVLLGPFLTITNNVNKKQPLINDYGEILFWLILSVIGILSYILGVRRTASYKNKTINTQLHMFNTKGSVKFTVSSSTAIFLIVTCGIVSLVSFSLISVHSGFARILFLIFTGLFFGVLSIYVLYVFVLKVPLLIIDTDGVHIRKLESRIRNQTFIPWNLIINIYLQNKTLFTPYFPYFFSLGFINIYLNINKMSETTPEWLKGKQVVRFNIGMLNIEPDVIYRIIHAASNNQRNADTGADAPPPVR